MKKILPIICVVALLSGCANLPEVSAKKIHYQSSFPIGGTTIDMTGVEVTPTEVKAESYRRSSHWWTVSQDIEIDGYSRVRKPDAPSISTTP